LQTSFDILPHDNGCRLIIPFTRQDGGYIEFILSQKAPGEVRITDDCGTSDYLFLNGLTLEANDELLGDAENIATRHHVSFVSSELSVTVREEKIGDGLHRLISAALELGDLIYKRRQRAISVFDEEVEAFFLSREIPVERRYDIRGKTATHNVGFYINGQFNWLAEALSIRSVQSARTRGRLIAFQWLDIRNLVKEKYTYTVILDDRQSQKEEFWGREDLAKPVFDYSTFVFYWSEIDRLPEELRSELI
jgi:hypothetical protein